MFVKLYADNPNERQLRQVVDCLKNGGVIISPTDTVYGISCDIYNIKAFEKLCYLTKKVKEKSNFSFICSDLSNLSEFTKPINNSIFKLMRQLLPGPYTFVLEANSNVPKAIQKKKTIGIRVPDNNIPREIVRMLGNPIMNASLKVEDDIMEYITDPELIYEQYADKVDMVIDGGNGDYVPSTVLNCVGGTVELIRQGKGVVDFL
ncbi:MAG: threonylcarbamoyl-AMP synthase [Bacteroidales bacterium]|nr:threonylcarbamoyl-AMP synthase [Bacteroidales bacterium]